VILPLISTLRVTIHQSDTYGFQCATGASVPPPVGMPREMIDFTGVQ